jgi:hypothetical protein
MPAAVLSAVAARLPLPEGASDVGARQTVFARCGAAGTAP